MALEIVSEASGNTGIGSTAGYGISFSINHRRAYKVLADRTNELGLWGGRSHRT